MKTNDFFERVVYIGEETTYKRVSNRISKQEITASFVPALDGAKLVKPPESQFSPLELAEIVGFHNIVLRANVDRVASVLILAGNIKFAKDYQERSGLIFSQFSEIWDLMYLGYDDVNYRELKPKGSIVQLFHANGIFAVGINSRFYHLFLETARVPVTNLDTHILSLSLALGIYGVTKPLVQRAAR